MVKQVGIKSHSASNRALFVQFASVCKAMLVLFVFAGFAADGSVAFAQITAKKAEAARAKAASLSPSEAFMQARQAVQRNDLVLLSRVAEQARQHPLGIYVDYWELRLRLSQPGREPALEQAVRAFMDKHAGTVYADLLRRDFMLSLGRTQDWDTLEDVAKPWVLLDDRQAFCYWQLASMRKSRQFEPQAKEALLAGGAFSEGCTALTEAALASGAVSASELLPRLASGIFSNAQSGTRAIVRAHSPWAELIGDAQWAKPASAIAQPAIRANKEALTIAYLRLVGVNLEAAVDALKAEQSLTHGQRFLVWSLVAAFSAQRTQPVAHEYAAAAAQARTAELRAKTGAIKLPSDVGAWAVRAALRGSDWKSIVLLEAALPNDLRLDSTWIYWRGRAERETNQPREVWEKTFRLIDQQHNFYGQLAAEELGQLTKVSAPLAGETADALAQDPQVLAVVNSSAVKRARQFYELGFRFEGNREWNWAIRGLNDQRLNAVARWADRQQLFDRAISTADRTNQTHDFSMRFLTPFASALTVSAKNHGLDPALVFGLIRQESRFLVDVRSSVGATGLMQLMPATARWVAKRLGVSDFEHEQLLRPEINLEFGSFYFKTVLEALEGNAALAAAAYNAGPGRPKNWRATLPQKIDGAAFAETIPFSETRDYVKKVLSNTAFYGSLLTGQPQSLKQKLGEIGPKVVTPTDIP